MTRQPDDPGAAAAATQPDRAVGATGQPPASGQGLAEFALILPVLLLGLLFLFDFGRVVYAQNAINQDVNAAARMASAMDFCVDPGTGLPCTAIQEDAAIRNKARTFLPLVAVPDCSIYGETYPDPDPNCSTHAAGGAFRGCRTDANDPNTAHCIVVEIQISVPLITPLISNVVGGSFTVTARAQEAIR